MSQPPATTRTLFPGISSRAWEHPADRTALTALRGLKGFDQILKLLSGMLRERQHRLLYLASSARVGPRQFADLDVLLDECVQVLDAPVKPEMFVMQSPEATAYTIGMDKPFIVISTGLYDHDPRRDAPRRGARTRACPQRPRRVSDHVDASDPAGVVVRLHPDRRLGAARDRRGIAGMATQVRTFR